MKNLYDFWIESCTHFFVYLTVYLTLFIIFHQNISKKIVFYVCDINIEL